MADYFAQCFGVFPNGEGWSTGRHITSSQSPTSLLTTWANAWTAAWNDGTNGFKLVYPTGTILQRFSIATLGSSMQELAKVQQAATLAGVNTNESAPTQVSIVFPWTSSAQIGRTARGHQSMPAPSVNELVVNKLVSGTQTSLSAAMNMVKNAITADGSTFFLFPRFTTSTGIAPYTKTVVDTVKCRDKVGTQDKRYRKELATYV